MEDDVRLAPFAAVKAGNSDDEYEDAFAAAVRSTDGELCRIAVADGATGASFSGLWARLLRGVPGQRLPVYFRLPRPPEVGQTVRKRGGEIVAYRRQVRVA
ncbi:MAG TPA: hypothetical protein VM490_24815, partial [Armatimonadaceae bacterium]|nr:hypothetical protein [Armatimonadaceae bacterium]